MSTSKVEVEQHGELARRITTPRAELLIAQQGAQVLSYQRVGEPPLLCQRSGDLQAGQIGARRCPGVGPGSATLNDGDFTRSLSKS